LHFLRGRHMWDLDSQTDRLFTFHFSNETDEDQFFKWDSFSHNSADEDCGLAESLSQAFLPPKHFGTRHPTIQAPMRLVSVGLSDPATSHVATLPVTQTPRVFSAQSRLQWRSTVRFGAIAHTVSHCLEPG
jgi:hypothetical protein